MSELIRRWYLYRLEELNGAWSRARDDRTQQFYRAKYTQLASKYDRKFGSA